MQPPSSDGPQRIRVLVVEHMSMLREGICELLQSERDISVIGTAADGITALSLARESRPDVLLLELDLPKMSGLRVLELLQPATIAVRPLLFGMSIPAKTAIEALELGARGVVQHDQSPTLLFKSIRSVARGEYWVERSLVGDLARQVQLSSKPFGLTARERQIVSLVVGGHSNKEIAEHCKLKADTVKHHLTNIFNKTGASTRVELAVFALHHGVAGREPAEAVDPHVIDKSRTSGAAAKARLSPAGRKQSA